MMPWFFFSIIKEGHLNMVEYSRYGEENIRVSGRIGILEGVGGTK